MWIFTPPLSFEKMQIMSKHFGRIVADKSRVSVSLGTGGWGKCAFGKAFRVLNCEGGGEGVFNK